MPKICPHCGASLPEETAFCPHCAQSINQRQELKAPRPVLGKVLRIAIPLLVICAIVLAVALWPRPQTYDSQQTGQVLYQDGDRTYQLVLNQSDDRQELMPEKIQAAESGGEYRIYIRLYVNDPETGADLGDEFLAKMEDVSAEVIQDPDTRMSCTKPAPNDNAPEAAMVSFLSFYGMEKPGEMVWTIKMKNGDTILMRHVENVYLIAIHDYYPEDAPMGTVEEVQALMDQISADDSIDPKDRVYLHLPPVTYDGRLVMDKRPINLMGSTDEAENRTTFTAPVELVTEENWMTYFDGIDFVGDGTGVGVSGAGRLHITNCRITGWETGVLAGSHAWVNLDDCLVEGNQVGLHINSTDAMISDQFFSNNGFVDNGTAVLLEQLPSDLEQGFPGTRFQGNGTDIDNRCGQKIDTSNAVFK